MPAVDYAEARRVLNETFSETLQQCSPTTAELLKRYEDALDIVFESKTQSYREVLLGCALVHIINPTVNIRLPYVKQGPTAFNGRTLDEQAINPFLMSKQIPCSKGPYLATFRRNVRLDESTRSGLRDQHGYDAMLIVLGAIEAADNENDKKAFLSCLLKRFIILREKSNIQLSGIARMSVEQYQVFLNTLLHNQSGGLLPMLVTIAVFQTINDQYSCGWDINYQGINAADGATGAPGDITIFKNGQIVKAIEVTERPISETRVVTTFNTKISINDVKDYLFVYTATAPEDGAYSVAKVYFAQGYDINFIKLSNFILSTFIAGNVETRQRFTDHMLTLLRQDSVPAAVKTAWNDSLQEVIGA